MSYIKLYAFPRNYIITIGVQDFSKTIESIEISNFSQIYNTYVSRVHILGLMKKMEIGRMTPIQSESCRQRQLST